MLEFVEERKNRVVEEDSSQLDGNGREETIMLPIEYLIVIGIASILISVLLKLRKKSMIDYVLGTHPDLSKVEKDVARHIYHRGGEIWDVEITEVFKLPEADVGRLTKKLEHKGIITIWKDGPHLQLVLKKTHP